MEKGKLVEANSTDELFNNPVQDYTRELIEAVPGRNIQLNLRATGTREWGPEALQRLGPPAVCCVRVPCGELPS